MSANTQKRLRALFIPLLVIALLFVVWGWYGDSPGWPEVWALLSGNPSLDEMDRYILLHLRLPRIVLSLLAGMMLALSGLVLQGLFRNPLMDPFIIGVSGGGALGAGFAMLLGLEFWWMGFSSVTLLAFASSLVVVWLVYQLGQYRGIVVLERILLAGVAMSSLSSSLLALCLVIKGKGMDQVVYWIMGSLTGKGWRDVLTLLPFLCLAIPIIIRYLHPLNLMQIGEEATLSLGLQPERIKFKLLIAATLLSAAVVSVCGVIGFIGLMVPHMARLWTGSGDFRQIFWPSVWMGAGLLLLADALSRNVLSVQEIPVGIFTALLGVPFFLSQLRRIQA